MNGDWLDAKLRCDCLWRVAASVCANCARLDNPRSYQLGGKRGHYTTKLPFFFPREFFLFLFFLISDTVVLAPDTHDLLGSIGVAHGMSSTVGKAPKRLSVWQEPCLTFPFCQAEPFSLAVFREHGRDGLQKKTVP